MKIKYRKKSETIMSDVIFKKLDLMKKISANKILSFNVMMKKIDEQKWYIAMIKYIQIHIKSKKNLKKHGLDDKQSFRLDTKNSNESTLYRVLSNNMKKISYFEKLFRWNFSNIYYLNYEHLKFLKNY